MANFNIFDTLQHYAGSWEVLNERPFNEDEIAYTVSASVVSGEFGMSVEFILKTGDKAYIPIDTRCDVFVGKVIDPAKCIIVTLVRGGEQTKKVFISE